MTLNEFISAYDKPGSVVLLEGKREVPMIDRELLISLGRILADRTRHMLFRSGNAKGADECFYLGAGNVDQVY